LNTSCALELEDREETIIKYLPLVKYIAGRMVIGKSASVDIDDLIGYGVIGLIDAIDKFDPGRGVKFETYASLRIKGAIIDELRKLSWVPRTAMGKLNKLNSVKDDLREKLGREPKDSEVADELGISMSELVQVEGYINYLSVTSLEDLIFKNDDEVCLSSMVEDVNSPRPDRILEEKETYDILKKAIDMLNEKDRLVLSLYYYEKLTLKEIGHVLGVSESRVSQLHSRMILRLKDNVAKLQYNWLWRKKWNILY